MLVVVVFAFGLSWVFTTLGLLLRSPNAVMNAGFMALFPLIFLQQRASSSRRRCPAGSRRSSTSTRSRTSSTAARGLMDGDPSAGDIGLVLVEAVVLTAIFAPLTTRLYRTRG